MMHVRVAKATDIAPGTAKRFELGSRSIAVCNVDGEFFAIDDTCTHEEASLSEGVLEGEEIECPLHAARFNVKTGSVVAPPAFVDLETFKVRVLDGDIEIELPG